MNKKQYTENDIIRLLKGMITPELGQNELAKKLGVSKGYFSEFLSGNRGIGEKILKALELKAVYVKKGKK